LLAAEFMVPHGALRGKRGFGAMENEIYHRRKLQSIAMANSWQVGDG
jgi:hypothetical protein